MNPSTDTEDPAIDLDKLADEGDFLLLIDALSVCLKKQNDWGLIARACLRQVVAYLENEDPSAEEKSRLIEICLKVIAEGCSTAARTSAIR
jgi:uncharacterized protein with ATP-grasp and redox domains